MIGTGLTLWNSGVSTEAVAGPSYGPAITPIIRATNATSTVTDVGNDTYQWAGDGSGANVLDFDVTIGKQYFIELEVTQYVEGGLKVQDDAPDDVFGVNPITATVTSKVWTAVSDDIRVSRASGPQDLTAIVRVREVL